MRELLIQLNLLPGLGSRCVDALADAYGALEPFMGASVGAVAAAAAVPVERAEDWLEEARRRPAAREIESAASIGAALVTRVDDGYPRPLFDTVGAPAVLYVRGGWIAGDDPAVAVVGSRRPTPYGMHVARRIGLRLADAGVTVVSGMARGVDGAAHDGALDGGGRTVAVLGCGIDRCYPPGHEALAAAIAARGAVLSEFPLGVAPAPFHFPQRNRIISGLSRAVVVVEAASRSGSLITARLALEQGREVFAVPGPVTSALSRGAHRLLDEGARLLQDVDDVIEAVGRVPGVVSSPPTVALSDDEAIVLECIGAMPTPIDDVVRASGLATERVAAVVATLELKDRVRDVGGGRVVALDA